MAAVLKRVTNVATILSEEGLDFFAAKLGLREGRAKGHAEGGERMPVENELPVRLRRTLERLGPLFVKFGQVLCMRVDLLPEAYCFELRKLHASVPTFDPKLAIDIIEAELGVELATAFQSFDETPLAAASLAQVHAARLPDGSEVVVKVQRPGAVESVEADLELLLGISRQLDRFVPQYKAAQVHRLALEFAHSMRQELDLCNEARMAQRFHDNFARERDIFIPAVHRQLCSGRVMVMEKVPGARLDKVPDADALRRLGGEPTRLLDAMLRCVMHQSYIHGLIHADMHPGNVFVLPDGRIGLIDFGMVAEVDRRLQNAMVRTMVLRVEGRHEELADALLEDVLTRLPGADEQAYRDEIISLNKKLQGASLREYNIGRVILDESAACAKHGFVGPSELLMLARAMVTVEGLALRYCPHESLTERLKPVIQRLFVERFDASRIIKEFAGLIPDVLELIEMAPSLHRNILRMERAFALSRTPGEFIANELMPRRAEADRRGAERSPLGAWLAVVALWGSGTAAALLKPADMPAPGGLPWIAWVAFALAVALMGMLTLGRRSS